MKKIKLKIGMVSEKILKINEINNIIKKLIVGRIDLL